MDAWYTEREHDIRGICRDKNQSEYLYELHKILGSCTRSYTFARILYKILHIC